MRVCIDFFADLTLCLKFAFMFLLFIFLIIFYYFLFYLFIVLNSYFSVFLLAVVLFVRNICVILSINYHD